MKIEVTTDKEALKPVIKHLAKALPKRGHKRFEIILTIEALFDTLRFVVPGAEYKLHAKTQGYGKACLSFFRFADIIMNSKDEPMNIYFEDKEMKINKNIYGGVQIENYENLKTIDVTINYTDLELLQKYCLHSWKDIEKQGYASAILEALDRHEKRIGEIKKILNPYKIASEEIRNFVNKEIDFKF